jgi:anti-sigma regulatory factor (Ser/Thr protein kinase)
MTFIVRSSRISCVREVRKTVELSLEEMKRLETVVMEIVSEFAEKIDTST